MSGFKNFLLRGNLVDLAVAVIIATAFGAVVSTFTNWLTEQLPDSTSEYFSNQPNSLGAFLNAVVSFVILAAVVYFFVVLPYTKAKERYFPSPPAGTPEDVELLRQIRDLLAGSGPGATGAVGGSHAGPPA
ncbi:Large-conductance mechanosensitive channel [Nocardioides aquaticus]|uniref:Large-conductance mechanosensitive channel n=1 Tax=Nocardioides aquaticus TaxID=160826 RepID=A0ABX8EP17_9ACTN|nr:MscL family protein [Nocardioides aquaticus]QVT81605.1 Large-conductance mechanosensitive channel [Nocardioides aquaticus]